MPLTPHSAAVLFRAALGLIRSGRRRMSAYDAALALRRNYGLPEGGTFSALMGIGQRALRAIRAGRSAERRTRTPQRFSDLPVDSRIMWHEPRIRYSVLVTGRTVDGEQRRWVVDVNSDTPLTRDQIREAARAAHETHDTTGRATSAPIQAMGPHEDLSFRIISAGRRG